MKKILALALAIVMMLSMTACGSKGGNDTDKVYELKVSTTQTEKSMIYAGLQAAADSVAEKTNGKVKITIYPSSQLGAEEDMIDQALQGMGIAVLTDAGRLSSYVNDIGILNMAYIVENYDQGLKLMETETFKGWDKGLIEKGIRTLTYNYYDGARSFMGNEKFETPESLKGVVCRTPGAAPYVESITALGATPYNIAWSEVYNGIQTKAIDACEVQYTSAVSSAMYEVCDYVSKTEHINLFNMVICGEKWFSKLPAEYQTILLEEFFNAGYNNAQEIIAAQDTMEATLIEKGMEIVEVDKAIFMEAAEAAYAKLGWTELRTQLYTEAGLN